MVIAGNQILGQTFTHDKIITRLPIFFGTGDDKNQPHLLCQRRHRKDISHRSTSHKKRVRLSIGIIPLKTAQMFKLHFIAAYALGPNRSVSFYSPPLAVRSVQYLQSRLGFTVKSLSRRKLMLLCNYIHFTSMRSSKKQPVFMPYLSLVFTLSLYGSLLLQEWLYLEFYPTKGTVPQDRDGL